ncbi:YybH family protein [Pseudoxanthomonas mexicana]
MSVGDFSIRHLLRLNILALLSMLLSAGVTAGEVTTPQAEMNAVECEVFNRELAFAKTVDRHDVAAFSSFLLEGAVFNVGTNTPVRGASAITQAWAGIISGKTFSLKWRPEFALIGGDPDTAITHGPYLIWQANVDGKSEYAAGHFSSVWKRMPNGEWFVLFDGGGEPPRKIAATEAQALFDGLPTQCG